MTSHDRVRSVRRKPGVAALCLTSWGAVVFTTAGDVDVAIPRLRAGSFVPSLLERRRRIDQALFAVVTEAYVTGTSVRKVDDLVKAMGADTGMSKSEVSRICADLDEQVFAFADRDLSERGFPYLCLDARPGSAAPATAPGRGWCPRTPPSPTLVKTLPAERARWLRTLA